jgi:SAM-dependent methyltransferase
VHYNQPMAAPPDKPYDRTYFDEWYRRRGFGSPAALTRKVAYALSAAEYLLGGPVRRVLDVGCGEGAWQPVLRRLRPGASYLGIDPSTYVIERYGPRRHLRLGDLGHLDRCLGPTDGPYDLVVCSDVLGYVPDEQIAPGLATIEAHLRGVALLEVFTSEDAGSIDGDLTGYELRARRRWQGWYRRAGLTRIGPNLFTGTRLAPTLAGLEGALT